MIITKANIINYKCFAGKFPINFKDGINIIVGDNESGKSTILEAINIALTGTLNGRPLRYELNQYLFNKDIVSSYLSSLKSKIKQDLPSIIIEVFFSIDDNPKFLGTNNSERIESSGVVYKIEFDDSFKSEYQELIKSSEQLDTIPIEYYKISWYSFAEEYFPTARSIPIKSALIDSSSARLQNSSDIYISKIIQNNLEDIEKINLSQAYRKMKESFGKDDSVISINKKIQDNIIITKKKIEISAELPTQSAWESSLMTFVDDTPFQQIGKGEQCVIKTNLALEHKKSQEAALILLEEPENHLTYTKLNELINNIQNRYSDKQIIITTHNSFVANKLDLKNLILLNNHKTARLDKLNIETYNFFKKLAGYPTLRLILCKKAVLVEGDSDELIFQKAYLNKFSKLPVQDGIDVISVGLSFKRFLEIAAKIEKKVAVITDNDGNYKEKIEKKYDAFKEIKHIEIFADTNEILNTLEPQFVNSNTENLQELCKIIHIDYSKYNNFDSIVDYMKKNKTEWALAVFETDNAINFPEYIKKAVEWCNE
ncbi:ATP-dependent nuclease [Treponema primitia]|uniref:ATP-dependent nuclease n=1 Tax=Treponema primitia TaxID=88058 RepID=UPI0002554C03|nr:AAA family ATPase [Treponema primitia]